MGAPTQYYVDPSIAGDSGAGTSGDPYGDLQYALDQVGTSPGRDATNGDRFNIKAGTDEVMSSGISLATYGGPSATAPLIFQGYTTTAGDGGIGGVSGGGSSTIINASGTSYVHFLDLHCHNTGSNIILRLNTYSSVQRCEIDNCTSNGIQYGAQCLISDCNIHNISAVGVLLTGTSIIKNCYFTNGANDFSDCINLPLNAVAYRNILSIDGATNGIELTSVTGRMINNSIISSGGTGTGLLFGGVDAEQAIVDGNLIEGFSGVGGIAADFASSARPIAFHGHNGYYNNTTNEANASDSILIPTGTNESLGASPFDKSGSDTFANRFTYFAPVDTGNVHGGAYPSGSRVDKGAVQHADPAGGGGGGFIDGIQRIESGLNL